MKEESHIENRREADDLKGLLAEFHDIDSRVVWGDFLLNVLLSWPLFIYTCFNPNLITFVISIFFLYRGSMLIHEVVHISKKVTGYRFAYNFFFGWFTSYPAYIFDGHLFHHGKATYATKRDPEYKYIPQYNMKTLVSPIISAFILPLFQLIRFGLLPFVLPFLPEKYQVKVYQKMSTLVFDVNYKRPIRNKTDELRMMIGNDLMCALYKVATILLVVFEILPLRFITYFYIGFVFCSILNMYRALFNHLYTNESLAPLSKEEHILDTTTVEGGLLTKIIFVNGLNYHALHHLFPEIPYYHLGRAHKKLMQELPSGHLYKKSVYPSFFSLLKYCVKERDENVLVNS